MDGGTGAKPGLIQSIGPEEIARIQKLARFIDVREPPEYHGELGHAPGAKLVPLGTLRRAAAKWDRATPIIVICRAGTRSAQAAVLLAEMGFSCIYDVRGGMRAYCEAKLPTTRS